MTFLDQADMGARIAELRAARGVSQRQLADHLGVDGSALSRIESGDRGLAVGELVAIAEFLAVDMEALLTDDSVAAPLFRNEGGDAEARDAMEAFTGVIDDFFAVQAAARG